MSTYTERLSAQRDDIYDWVVNRFKELMAEDDHCSALALADEYFEWLDPDQMDDEEIHFYDERELISLHDSLKSE
jgi:hypothetical protein